MHIAYYKWVYLEKQHSLLTKEAAYTHRPWVPTYLRVISQTICRVHVHFRIKVVDTWNYQSIHCRLRHRVFTVILLYPTTSNQLPCLNSFPYASDVSRVSLLVWPWWMDRPSTRNAHYTVIKIINVSRATLVIRYLVNYSGAVFVMSALHNLMTG
jgi:hypothetical protein